MHAQKIGVPNGTGEVTPKAQLEAQLKSGMPGGATERRDKMKNGITVLSLFDGISCGRVALERCNIPIKKYLAAEIDRNAIKVTMSNYPDTIQIGDVRKVSYHNGALKHEYGTYNIGQVDILMGGSPCQDISRLKQGAKGVFGEKSSLFFEFLRLLREVNPKYYLLENVKAKKESEEKISECLQCSPICIDSALVSYQHRRRLYWTNIPNVKQPKNKKISFQDFIERDEKICRMYKLNKTPSRIKMWKNGEGINDLGTCKNVTRSVKINCLTTKQDRAPNSGLIECDDFCRTLTRREIEQAQTLPVGYTDAITYPQMQKACGNGWTVDVICHILSYANFAEA